MLAAQRLGGGRRGELCQGGFCPSMRVVALPRAPGFRLRLSLGWPPASAWHLLKGRPSPGMGAVRVSEWGIQVPLRARRGDTLPLSELNATVRMLADSFRVLVPSVLGLVLGVENREGALDVVLCP